MAHEEYLRRNLLHANSIGARAGVRTALERLSKMKRAPHWIVDAFEQIGARVEDLPAELAAWRNQADDAPIPMKKR